MISQANAASRQSIDHENLLEVDQTSLERITSLFQFEEKET